MKIELITKNQIKQLIHSEMEKDLKKIFKQLDILTERTLNIGEKLKTKDLKGVNLLLSNDRKN